MRLTPLTLTLSRREREFLEVPISWKLSRKRARSLFEGEGGIFKTDSSQVCGSHQAKQIQVVAMYLTPASTVTARGGWVQNGGNKTSLAFSGHSLACSR